jgi:DNA helicase HerA-like ATPase
MHNNPEKMAIVGRSGYGKSSMMNRVMRKHKRVILFDHVDERDTEAKREGFTEVRDFNQLQDLVDRHYKTGFRYWFHPDFRDNLIKHLHNLSDFMLDIQADYGRTYGVQNRPSLMLAVDEMKNSFPNHALKKDEDMFSYMCSEGRHKGIHLIGATQRPAEVSTKFRGQMEKIIMFNLNLGNDLDAIEAWGGKKDGKQLREAVRLLERLEYIRMENGAYTRGKLTF